MISLPNNCYCSELKVFPKTWKTKQNSITKEWYIYYRYYDPISIANKLFPKGKLVIVKGMNHFKDHADRLNFTCRLIEKELNRLKDGFNPIRGNEVQMYTVAQIAPEMGMVAALMAVKESIKGSSSTKRDLKSIMNFVENAAMLLKISDTAIHSVTRKHIKMVLAQIDYTSGESAHRYNKIRSYLMMLFKELVEMEAINFNPVKDISKMKTTQRLRKVLSQEQREKVDKYLKANHYRFWLFTHIFFHSGARLTEMMKIRVKQVNIKKQEFVIMLLKGKSAKEVLKPIKDIALPFWIEALAQGKETDYVFSKSLRPGPELIQSYQITKRWSRLVKMKLGIKEDFYSLKHLNLDETANILGIGDAAQMASHTSTDITIKHYAVGEKERQNKRLKQVGNKFA